MYSAALFVALAGSAVAQGTYDAAACPAAGETSADGRYSCNPAHSYPAGQVCTLSEGCYYLRTEAPGVSAPPSSSVAAPTHGASSTSSTAACPAPGTTSADGRYSCNPAHSYPSGQVCTLSEGCYYLRTETPGLSVSASPSVSLGEPKYFTTTVSAITTYCPQPTTFVHSASTYVVTEATTLTVPCPGGCVVTSPATVPAPTAPAYKPTGSSTLIPSASQNGTATRPIATYTGAGAIATGAPLAAMAALGAFFL